MKRTHLLTNSLALVALAVSCLPSVASASTIFLAGTSTTTPYTTGGVATTAFTSSAGVSGIVVSTQDTKVSGSYAILEATDGASGNPLNAIYAYSSTGVKSVFASFTGPVIGPEGLAINAAGDVFTGVAGGSSIEEFSPTGTALSTTFSNANVSTVDSLAVDANGDLFEADESGYINEFFYNNGTYSSSTTLNISQNLLTGLPAGDNYEMTFDASGDLYIAYQSASLFGGGIWEINASQINSATTYTPTAFYTLTGSSPTSPAYHFNPTGIVDDNVSGNLYLSYLNTPGGTQGGAEMFTYTSSTGTLSNTPVVFATNAGDASAIGYLYATPEPGTITMLFGGLLAMFFMGYRRALRQA